MGHFRIKRVVVAQHGCSSESHFGSTTAHPLAERNTHAVTIGRVRVTEPESRCLQRFADGGQGDGVEWAGGGGRGHYRRRHVLADKGLGRARRAQRVGVVHIHFARVRVVDDRVFQEQRVNVLAGLRLGLGQRLVVPLQRRAVPRPLLNGHQLFSNRLIFIARNGLLRK